MLCSRLAGSNPYKQTQCITKSIHWWKQSTFTMCMQCACYDWAAFEWTRVRLSLQIFIIRMAQWMACFGLVRLLSEIETLTNKTFRMNCNFVYVNELYEMYFIRMVCGAKAYAKNLHLINYCSSWNYDL